MSRFRLVFALVLTALTMISPARAEVLDRIVAVVNDGVVLQSELERAVSEARDQLRTRGINDAPDEAVRSQVLERLILVRLQTQRAQQAGIRIDDRELNDVLGGIAQRSKMTLAQFADAMRREGVDFLSVREQVRDEVTVQRLRQREVDSRVQTTDQDIDLFLAGQGDADNTEYRLSHILVSMPDGASSEEREKARAKAEGLLKRLQAGEDFAQLAVANSDGQQALQGGDLDWRKGADLPALFANTAAKLKVGEISKLLETSSGLHIIKLVETRGSSERQTVEETRSQHILLAINQLRTEDEARAQARALYDRIIAGEDLGSLSAKYSDDPGSKNNKGDLGWQPPGVFAPEFQTALDALKPGEISAPFRTQFGWHIAKVNERRTRDTTEESRRGRARQAILQRKAAEEYDTWLRRLRDEAYIEYRLKTDADAAAAAKT